MERTPFDKVYFANSGAEANEALLKLARRWHHEHGRSERVELVSALHSFHGRTMGALAVTPRESYQTPFKPMMPGATVAEYNNLGSF